jgi:hypothetical protein
MSSSTEDLIPVPCQEGFGILTEADGTERHGFWLNGELQ